MYPEILLEINRLSFSYGFKKVLDEVTLSVCAGSVHGILGSNGAGKTTLFNALFAHEAHETSIRIADAARKNIAYLRTDPFFYPYMTGREYLAIVCQQRQLIDTESWNKLFTLPLDEYVHRYSTGMKKKLALLGVILLDRGLLILDEPFNGLDLESCETVRYIIARLRHQGKTILLSSHIYETLTANCDCISMLEGGRVVQTFKQEAFAELTRLVQSRFRDSIAGQVDQLLP